MVQEGHSLVHKPRIFCADVFKPGIDGVLSKYGMLSIFVISTCMAVIITGGRGLVVAGKYHA
jgi:hypothetical protein